jgi:hypothetical protein
MGPCLVASNAYFHTIAASLTTASRGYMVLHVNKCACPRAASCLDYVLANVGSLAAWKTFCRYFGDVSRVIVPVLESSLGIN